MKIHCVVLCFEGSKSPPPAAIPLELDSAVGAQRIQMGFGVLFYYTYYRGAMEQY